MLVVNLVSIDDATPAEERFVRSTALPLLQRIINGRDFKRRVEQYQWGRRSGFVGTRLDNATVLAKLLAGDEGSGPNRAWDLKLWIYAGDPGTFGFTGPTDPVIHMNRNALTFAQSGLGTVLGNIAHEYCHKLGFDHPRLPTPRRPGTVPYAIGDIVEELATSAAASNR